VPDDTEQVAVEVRAPESRPLGKSLGVTFDDQRVPAPVFRAELPGDEDRTVALPARRPVALGPLTDL